ncbi:MAG TPA: hypothetical protein VFN10_10790 [Thermoanaerobaculia bacterium]|nr:hypothetical protein [Thermoanaerobaculia bacterium]
MRTRKLLWIVVFLAAMPLFAQKGPTEEVGFNPSKLYDFNNIDAVNLFNGNVTATLPLARYRVSSTLSYQFTLVYNSKHWDTGWASCDDTDPETDLKCPYGIPSRQSNAGWGWRMSLGRLLAPADPSPNKEAFATGFVYEGPAGDEHEFGISYTAPVLVSDDPQPLRVVRIDANNRNVEFPNGEVHKFALEHEQWRLKEMADPFGNYVKIDYTYSSDGDGKYYEFLWTIRDSAGRSHSVWFVNQSALSDSWSRGQSVSAMTLDGYKGADNIYTFHYAACDGVWSYPVLRSVDLPGPQSTSYAIDYDDHCRVAKVTLPTGGSVAYTYQNYTFADPEEVCNNGPFGSDIFDQQGIATRTVSDGSNDRVWQYIQRRGPVVPVDWDADHVPCEPYPGNTYPQVGPYYWSRTTVLEPSDQTGRRARTDHYFNIFSEPLYPDANAHPFPAANNLPFGYAGVAGRPPDSRAKGTVTEIPEELLSYPADVSGSDLGATLPAVNGDSIPSYLASRTYDGCLANGDCSNGKLLRSTYLRYECLHADVLAHPNKCWAVSSRTIYDDDPGCGEACFSQETSTGPTGSGLYTTVTTKSNFPAAGSDCTASAPCARVTTSETYTAYPFWTLSDLLDSTKKWFAGTYSERRHTEGASSIVSKFRFAPATGALEATRKLKGLILDGEDLLTIYGYDSKGNLIQEKSYGGDCAVGSATCTRLSETSCCDVPTSGLQYLQRHAYDAANRLIRSDYIDPASCSDVSEATCSAIAKTYDATFDLYSGVILSNRDSAGIATTYDYDFIGRLTKVTPPGAAVRTYAYTTAASGTNAKATETLTGTNGVSLGTSTYEFDGLGRVKRVSTPLPESKLATVQTDYDHAGRPYRVSQPVEQTVHPTTDVGTYRTTAFFDALGRQTSVGSPDGTATSFTYTGARVRTRSSLVATSAAGSSSAKTAEYYDALGRLRRVEEASASTFMPTDYTYDATGNLISVSDGDDQVPNDRAFTFDGRGFLNSEMHPENGATLYGGYDARGHARQTTMGARTLHFSFDAAERLTNIAEVLSGSERALVDFEFGGEDAGTKAGRLKSSVRHNLLQTSGAIDVTHKHDYSATTGGLTKQTTLIEQVNGTTRTTVQESDYVVQSYDDYSLPKTIQFPTCSASGCSVGAGLNTLTFDRNVGYLTSVQNFAALTYSATGMVKTVAHASVPAATDTYATAFDMARPSSITFSGGTAACPALQPSAIVAPDSICAAATGSASVASRTGITHTWTIDGGGVLTSASSGDAVTFSSPASGSVILKVAATDSCGATAEATKVITVLSRPTSQLSVYPVVVESGTATLLTVMLTGTGPWRLDWSDGYVQTVQADATKAERQVAPNVTTNYFVTASSGGCAGSQSQTVTVTVVPHGPDSVTATTQTNRSVRITWTPVAGASSYLIERAPRRNDVPTWTQTVSGTVNSYDDVVPASVQPVTYIYHIRTVSSDGTLSSRAAWDFATAATNLYVRPVIDIDTMEVGAVDVAELRAGIDALRYALYLPATFNGAVPSGWIRAADFTALVVAMNEARAANTLPAFGYIGVPAPVPGNLILSEHVHQIREALR